MPQYRTSVVILVQTDSTFSKSKHSKNQKDHSDNKVGSRLVSEGTNNYGRNHNDDLEESAYDSHVFGSGGYLP